MSGEVAGAGDRTPELLLLVHEIAAMCFGGASGCASSEFSATDIAAGDALFRKDCTDLVRRISLLTHLLEEIRELKAVDGFGVLNASTSSTSSASSWSSDLMRALQSAKRLLSVAGNFRSNCSTVSVFLFFLTIRALPFSSFQPS